MKGMYEGMFIFPKGLTDEALEEAVNQVRDEIKKLDGAVKSVTRLGKRPFARTLGGKDAGHYVVMEFDFDGHSLPQLQARLKLNDNVFRAQVVRAKPAQPAAAGAKSTEAAT
ncbi:MAG: 30S ribosomal protein S6 [Kiritimatiellae bacterium]|nr:30S ribosomal protein S6 [Kiritimatiellia bacterium]